MMPVRPLLTVFGFLSGRAATVGTSDVLLLLGLGLHLPFVLGLIAPPSEVNAIFEDILKIVHNLMMEQSYACEGHRNPILIAGLDHIIITH